MPNAYIDDASYVTTGSTRTLFEVSENAAGTKKLRWNTAATAAPTTGDDDADGYSYGSIWVDNTNDRVYFCADATTGAAVWLPLPKVPTSATDNAVVRFDGTSGSVVQQASGVTIDDSHNLTTSATLNAGAGAVGATGVSVGSTATGIYRPAASQLGLAANSEAVIVDNDSATPSLRPDADSTWDLGETATRWKTAYVDDITLTNLINSQRVPDGAGTAETGTTHSATSADDNRVIECSNASGCTVSANTGTAGSWRAYFASAASQQVTLQKGTLTTLYVPPSYDQGSSSILSEERYAIVGVFYLSSSVGIVFGRMAAV